MRVVNRIYSFRSILAGIGLLLVGYSGLAQGTAFSYQGQLGSGGNAASGNYDFQFTVFDAVTNGLAVSGSLTNSNVVVNNGLFTTTVDFGTNIFTGPNLWLGIEVRTNGTGVFTPLWPRQPVRAAPYAIFANSASNLVGVVSASQLSGTLPASAFTGYTNTVALTNGGNLFAGTFTGNGGAVTNVNVANLTGVLADSQLPVNTAFLNSNQTFTASNNFNGVNTFTNLGNSFSGSFFGNGLVGWVVVPGTSVQAQTDHGYLLTNSQVVTVTLPASANIGDIIRVAYSGVTGWELAQNAGQSILGNFQGFITTWTQDKQYDSWTGLASSADGTKMAATANGDNVYLSTDSGQTWFASGADTEYGQRQWDAIASSADGTHLVAVVTNGGSIYFSTNSGTTWSVIANSGGYWSSVASSSGGNIFAATDNGTGIYVFSGTTVISSHSVNANNWSSIAASASGSTLVAAYNGGSLYVSSNYGTNWSAYGISGENWKAVACSSDGTKMAAAVTGGYIYTSINSGVTWTQSSSPSANWISLACSSDGSKLVAAVSGGDLYTSPNWGTTWTAQTNNVATSANWSAVTVSADGSVTAAAIYSTVTGGIYSSPSSPETTTTAGTSGFISSGQGSAVELIYTGNNQFMPVSSLGTIWSN